MRTITFGQDFGFDKDRMLKKMIQMGIKFIIQSENISSS